MGSQKQAGEKIRLIRMKLGLTQVEVADRAKVSITHYAGIERGEENPSYEVLENMYPLNNGGRLGNISS